MASPARHQRGLSGSTPLLVLLAVLAGLAAGVGGYALVYAEEVVRQVAVDTAGHGVVAGLLP